MMRIRLLNELELPHKQQLDEKDHSIEMLQKKVQGLENELELKLTQDRITQKSEFESLKQ